MTCIRDRLLLLSVHVLVFVAVALNVTGYALVGAGARVAVIAGHLLARLP